MLYWFMFAALYWSINNFWIGITNRKRVFERALERIFTACATLRANKMQCDFYMPTRSFEVLVAASDRCIFPHARMSVVFGALRWYVVCQIWHRLQAHQYEKRHLPLIFRRLWSPLKTMLLFTSLHFFIFRFMCIDWQQHVHHKANLFSSDRWPWLLQHSISWEIFNWI